jgi:hypothetical protein
MLAGHCPGPAHERDNLGLGGRRVLVSRHWSGKTVARHKADRAEIVRAALEEAGIDPEDHDELSASGSDGRWQWEVVGRSRVDDHTYTAAIAQAIETRQRWRRQYETAKTRAGPCHPAGAGATFSPQSAVSAPRTDSSGRGAGHQEKGRHDEDGSAAYGGRGCRPARNVGAVPSAAHS